MEHEAWNIIVHNTTATSNAGDIKISVALLTFLPAL